MFSSKYDSLSLLRIRASANLISVLTAFLFAVSAPHLGLSPTGSYCCPFGFWHPSRFLSPSPLLRVTYPRRTLLEGIHCYCSGCVWACRGLALYLIYRFSRSNSLLTLYQSLGTLRRHPKDLQATDPSCPVF